MLGLPGRCGGTRSRCNQPHPPCPLRISGILAHLGTAGPRLSWSHWGPRAPRTVRRGGGMQSHGALLVMVDEQLDQWQSSASELKCGRLCVLADWSLALHGGSTCSASRMPKAPVPLLLLGPLHLDSASVAFAEGLDDAAGPAPSASTQYFVPPSRPWHDHSHMSNDHEESLRAWTVDFGSCLGTAPSSFALVGNGMQRVR